ncbi:hemerythrin domain-containing protein [Terasakiella pusilla]|uniref:hemerythrin domain-containing protein n=1 Tax=Terasakiella pusilla TaxID=64973 RepID=UPI003AA91373
MQDAISIIKDEHISISSVLKGMVEHIEQAMAGEREADPFLLAAMLDYVETIPEKVHHPKEDQYLFRLLRKRTHAADRTLAELEEEHKKTPGLLKNMRLSLKTFKKEGDLPALENAIREYARFHFAHMRKEEKEIIPLAVEHLTAEDWHEIHAAFQLNMKNDLL